LFDFGRKFRFRRSEKSFACMPAPDRSHPWRCLALLLLVILAALSSAAEARRLLPPPAEFAFIEPTSRGAEGSTPTTAPDTSVGSQVGTPQREDAAAAFLAGYRHLQLQRWYRWAEEELRLRRARDARTANAATPTPQGAGPTTDVAAVAGGAPLVAAQAEQMAADRAGEGRDDALIRMQEAYRREAARRASADAQQRLRQQAGMRQRRQQPHSAASTENAAAAGNAPATMGGIADVALTVAVIALVLWPCLRTQL
jgi:hypothetical protein